MRDEDVSELISGYLQNTESDDTRLELDELRLAIDKLTTTFTSSTQTHEKQKLLVAAISLIAIHLRMNDVRADIFEECQKQLANLTDQRPSELFTPTRKASRQHNLEDEEKFCVVVHLCDQYPNEEDAIISDGEVLLFKSKKAPEYRRPFAYPAASQGGEDALVIAMMGGSLLLVCRSARECD